MKNDKFQSIQQPTYKYVQDSLTRCIRMKPAPTPSKPTNNSSQNNGKNQVVKKDK